MFFAPSPPRPTSASIIPQRLARSGCVTDSDGRIRDLCGVCLGEVGAIDPARVGLRLRDGGASGGSSQVSRGCRQGPREGQNEKRCLPRGRVGTSRVVHCLLVF